MKQEIIKSGIVRRVVEKIENESGLVVPLETTDIILTAFLDTVADILSEGNTIKLKGYMTIYPQLHKAKQIKNVSDGSMIIIPDRYKAKVRAGKKWENACRKLIKEK